jgi:hypothetical protein
MQVRTLATEEINCLKTGRHGDQPDRPCDLSHAKKETLWPAEAVAFGPEASNYLWTQFSSAGEASDNAFKSH